MKSFAVFAVLSLLAALVPLLPKTGSAAARPDAFPGWNAGPVDPQWTQQTLGAREAGFARDFPGRIGVFTDGSRTFIVRWVSQPTRQLHPVAYCLRALGYAVEPRPIREKADHSQWGAVAAQRGAEHLLVYERIFGPDGQAWTDVSAWFWHAALGHAQGPWWTITEIIPV